MSRPPETLLAKIERLRAQITDLDERKQDLEQNLAKAMKRLERNGHMDVKDLRGLEPKVR